MPVVGAGLHLSGHVDARCIVVGKLVGPAILWDDLQRLAAEQADWLRLGIQQLLVAVQSRPLPECGKLLDQRQQGLVHWLTCGEVRRPGYQCIDFGVGLQCYAGCRIGRAKNTLSLFNLPSLFPYR